MDMMRAGWPISLFQASQADITARFNGVFFFSAVKPLRAELASDGCNFVQDEILIYKASDPDVGQRAERRHLLRCT
jgi:hypothetical protein